MYIFLAENLLLNENVFDHILTFLGNQSLVKLQSITGDKYPNVKPLLAQLCCSNCENDNPAIANSVCTNCHSKQSGYKPLVTKTEAKEMYGIRDFDGISYEARRHYFLYKRKDLDIHMISLFSSKDMWLESIFKKNQKRLGRIKAKEEKEREMTTFRKSLSTEFNRYIESVSVITTSKAIIQQQSDRFNTLYNALNNRNLKIRNDSVVCQDYVIRSNGYLSDIVDTMEEMDFLFKHTNYSSQVTTEIRDFKEFQSAMGWIPREEYNYHIELCKDVAKMKICIEYLSKPHSHLPVKWLSCKDRYEQVIDAGIDPKKDYASEFIYSDSEDIEDVLKEHTRDMMQNAKGMRCQKIVKICQELNLKYKKIKSHKQILSYVNCTDPNVEDKLYESGKEYLHTLTI